MPSETGAPSSFLWTTTWKTRMTAKTDVTGPPKTAPKKPRLALAIATALGVGYIPKAPGTFGSLVGVATAYLSAVFFLRPTSIGGVFPLHPETDAVLTDQHFLVPGSDIHNAVLALPVNCPLVLLVLLGAIGIWIASRAPAHAAIKTPHFLALTYLPSHHL